LAECKPKPTVNCNSYSDVCISLSTTVIHNNTTVLILFPLILQTVYCLDVVYWREGYYTYSWNQWTNTRYNGQR